MRAIRDSQYRDYELIVVDDSSSDNTAKSASAFADRVIVLEQHSGVNTARRAGYKVARGEVLMNIDSDVLIFPDTLGKIACLFRERPEIDALTGMLSKNHPHLNFSSQYKNLYMHFTFRQLPDKATFIYGSLFAIRTALAKEYTSDIPRVEDTLFGQWIFSCG
ncbi:MAG: glycosyltransferase family A protein, partial [Candidatus Omnitrophica bacterium]|nr:glycosyltransferase family A protein [Candidatus Omnitrophota bacterium]